MHDIDTDQDSYNYYTVEYWHVNNHRWTLISELENRMEALNLARTHKSFDPSKNIRIMFHHVEWLDTV